MACAVASMPNAAFAADPGTTLTVTNKTSDVASTVGTNAARRVAINLHMIQEKRLEAATRGWRRAPLAAMPPAFPQVQLTLDPRILQRLQEPGSHRAVILQCLCVPDEEPPVDQWHDRHVLHVLLLHLGVRPLARIQRGAGLCLLQRAVHRSAALFVHVDGY